MSSVNPLFVLPEALHTRGAQIAAGLFGSFTLGVGQFCTKPGLLFVPSGDAGDDVVASLVDGLSNQSAMTMLSGSIASHFRAGVAEYESAAGVRTLVTHRGGDGAHVGAQLFEVAADTFADEASTRLRDECFGPLALVVRYASRAELEHALTATDPSLTFSVFRGAGDDDDAAWLLGFAPSRAGRIIVDGYPTGVGVSWSMEHGGPWPATTQPSSTSVGAASIERWLRPVTYQNVPDALLPDALRDANPLGVPQRVDGVLA